jgi:signal transduction histidine kinase
MNAIQAAYIGGFGLAAIACFASLRGLSGITDPDTRIGLSGLLVLSGLWAVTHVGRLLPISARAQATFYLSGLAIGLATVGAWLYFCSAYTGHEYHRQPRIRQAAVVLYLGIVGVKLTNPLHTAYFETTTATQPFPHVVILLKTPHWIVTGLSYALAMVGFYLLYEMLSESNSTNTTLGALFSTTAIPLVFYLVSFGDGSLVTLHYEPLGIAVFAVGALYAVDDQFVAVPRYWRRQLVDDLDEVVVLIDESTVIREYNQTAVTMFPDIADSEGTLLETAAPALAETLEAEDNITQIPRERSTVPRYLYVSTTPLTRVDRTVGQAIVCTDVTQVERQRQQLERQNDRLDNFAEAITHELRNTLAIADGYFDVAVDHREDDADVSSEAVTAVADAHDRMDRIITDLTRLAESGQTIADLEECQLGELVDTTYGSDITVSHESRVVRDAKVYASRSLLTELISIIARFADLNGANVVAFDVEEGTLRVTTDGEPLTTETIEDIFTYGEPVPSAETGMLFPTMRAIASSHGWTVRVDPQYRAGVKIEISDIEYLDVPSSTSASTKCR